MKKKIFVALTIGAAILLYWLLFSGISAEDMKDFIGGFGPLAPLAYIAAFTILPAFFFPVAVLALAGGLLFGLWRGALYTLLGAALNCSLMFWMARFAGGGWLERMVRNRLGGHWQTLLSRLTGREGFLFLIILRLIPAVPYNMINYAYGLAGMSYRTYILASVIGIIPGTFAFINIGDKALDLSSPDFLIAVGLLILLLAVTAFLGKHVFSTDIKKNGEKYE